MRSYQNFGVRLKWHEKEGVELPHLDFEVWDSPKMVVSCGKRHIRI
jgi:hypothetical protein